MRKFRGIQDYRSGQILKYRGAVFTAALFLFLLAFAGRTRAPKTLAEYVEKYGEEPIAFSCESGVYSSGITLELKTPGLLPEGAVLCYTTDGTEPSADGQRYEGPVRLDLPQEDASEKKDTGENTEDSGSIPADPAAAEGAPGDSGKDDTSGAGSIPADPAAAAGAPGDSGKDDTSGADYRPDNPVAGTKVYTVRAGIFFEGESTQIQCGTYCLGEGLFPCDGEYVVCVDTDPVNLYDYDTGILTGGRDLDEHNQSKHHGNYMQTGDDWIRLCHVCIFDGDGSLLSECNAGLSVSGGMSRRLDQKALNLSFGEPYGKEGEKLALDIFDDREAGDCAHVGKYTHLRLRARSQFTRTFRETLAAGLANAGGSRIFAQPRPGIVFLNGSFYTLAELEPSFSRSFLAHRFDLPDSDHIKKTKGKDVSVFRRMGVTSLFEADLTAEENQKALEAAVDMDDYLLYYAFNVLDNDLDWPRNNVEAWRWEGEYDPARPYTDGRLRFMIYDSDKIYNTNESIVKTFGTDNFVSMMKNIKRGYESPFRFVMQADPYREKFVTILCDLMNTSFEENRVSALLRKTFSDREEEFRSYFSASYMEEIEADYRKAQELAASRNEEVRQDLAEYFGLTDRYRMDLSCSAGVSVTWNHMYTAPGKQYACDYYRGVNITYAATASPGWRFDHWEVNGEPVRADGEGTAGGTAGAEPLETLGLSPEQTADGTVAIHPDSFLTVDGSSLKNGVCTVRAVAVPVDGPRLVIAEVSAAGDQDWIRLHNAGTTKIDLGQWCLTDDPENAQMFRLPREKLAPGESCVISGNHDPVEGALCSCNFSLTRDETLYLIPDEETGLATESLRIPYISADCSYGRRDNGGIFCWFDNRQIRISR